MLHSLSFSRSFNRPGATSGSMGTKASMGGLVALLKEGRLGILDSSDYQSIFQMIYIPTASYNTLSGP